MPGEEERVDATGSVTLDEMESSQTTPTPLNPSEFKLDSEAIPEGLRGKTLAEVIAQNEAMSNSLRLSESARIALEQSAARPPEPVRQPEPEPVQPQITREQLQEIYEKDPLEAIALINNLAIQNAARQYDTRMSQLTLGSVDSMENWARQNFDTEFKTLGPEIKSFVDSLPDKSIFASKKGWEDAVAYVRGLPGNFEKVMEAKQGGIRTSQEARNEQIADAGFAPVSSQRSRMQLPAGELDPTSKKIADEFIRSGVVKDYAEYIKWRDIA
jgi:hypothetical protein